MYFTYIHPDLFFPSIKLSIQSVNMFKLIARRNTGQHAVTHMRQVSSLTTDHYTGMHLSSVDSVTCLLFVVCHLCQDLEVIACFYGVVMVVSHWWSVADGQSEDVQGQNVNKRKKTYLVFFR